MLGKRARRSPTRAGGKRQQATADPARKEGWAARLVGRGRKGAGARQTQRQPRSGREVEVIYRFLLAGREGPPQRATTCNLGVGGAFIATDRPASPGTQLNVTLVWTSGHHLDVRAEVRWTGEQDGQSGMGLAFYGLDLDQLDWLGRYCEGAPG